MGSWGIKIKQSDYGLDLLSELVSEYLAPDGFRAFDVPSALKTLRAFCKEALGTAYGPGERLKHRREITYMWMVFYDPAYLLIADHVAEFYRTGALAIDAYDRETGEFIPKVIRKMRIPQWNLRQLIRKLDKMQHPDRPLCEKWGSDEKREKWLAYVQSLREELQKHLDVEGIT